MQPHYVSTNVRFKCPACKKQVDTEVEVPEVDYNYDRLSDSLSEDDIDIECSHCGASFGAHVQNSPSHCAVELSEYPDVEVSADDAPFTAPDPADEDEWLNEYSPEEPFDVFKDSYYRLGDIVAEYGIGGRGSLPHSDDVINRMAFAGAIGAMEAFLGDLLVNSVFSDETALRRLLKGDRELKEMAISLSEILENPNVVIVKTRQYLAGLLYHNLAKIGVLYKLALGVDILPDQAQKDRLFKAVLTRHDIVHRNGKDKSGNVIDLPTTRVVSTLDDVLNFVENVDKAVKRVVELAKNAPK